MILEGGEEETNFVLEAGSANSYHRVIDARGQEGAGKHGPGRLLRGLLRPSTLERVSTVAHTFTQKDGRTRDDRLYCCEIAAAASALRARTRADRTIGGDH